MTTVLLLLTWWVLLSYAIGAVWVLGHRERDTDLGSLAELEQLDKLAS